MKLYILIPFPYGHDRVQVFPNNKEDSRRVTKTNVGTVIPKTKKGKVKQVRESKRVLGDKKGKSNIRNTVRKGQKQAYSAQGKAKGKETGKATIHQDINLKGRQVILGVYKTKRQKVRPLWQRYITNKRTPNKARKEGRKVG